MRRRQSRGRFSKLHEQPGMSGPPALHRRMDAVLGTLGTDTPEGAVEAAAALLDQLLRDERMSRAAALDLLVADALVTGAFEAASDDPARVGARAEWAMRRIAALGEH